MLSRTLRRWTICLTAVTAVACGERSPNNPSRPLDSGMLSAGDASRSQPAADAAESSQIPADEPARWTYSDPKTGETVEFTQPARVPQDKPTDLLSAVSFLWTGPHPVQKGVEEGTVEGHRVSVIRGQVRDREGRALAGVRVTILNHPEFGESQTLSDGVYDIAVNGGGVVTVVYDKETYLPVQRQVKTPWRDFRWAKDVVMVRPDDKVTPVDFQSSTAEGVLASANEVSDDDGRRTCRVYFPPGTRAELELADGSRQPLPKMHFRCTEYTVGESGPAAMPAELPPTSGYTYAVDVTADEALAAGAVHVHFDRPVYQYVDNFLAVPAGTYIPNGAYNKAKAGWEAHQDGLALDVLSIETGVAVVDLDGSGNPATAEQLAAIDLTTAELRQLAMVARAGASYWRVPQRHFSDLNFSQITVANDAVACRAASDCRVDVVESLDDPCEQPGSKIVCQTQELGESLPTATGKLVFRSRHAHRDGAQHLIRAQLTGESPPPSLRAILVELSIAGRRFTRRFSFTSPAPFKTQELTFDGKSAYGQQLQGIVPFLLRVGYVYDAQIRGGGGQKSFGAVGGARGSRMVLNSPSRLQAVYWTELEGEIEISHWVGQAAGFGGWTLGRQHRLDLDAKRLYRGDGTQRTLRPYAIRHVAGIVDTRLSTTKPVPTHRARLDLVRAMRFDDAGGLYLATHTSTTAIHNTGVIRYLAPDGTLRTIAGRMPETQDEAMREGKATETRLKYLKALALGADGSVYATHGSRVIRIDRDGELKIVAGNGRWIYRPAPPLGGQCSGCDPGGSWGDEGPATRANLATLTALAVAPDQTIYVADSAHTVRRIDPSGTIHHYMGTRWRNGLPVARQHVDEVKLGVIEQLELDAQGGLWMLDGAGLWRIDEQGTLHEVQKNQPSAWMIQRFALGPHGDVYLLVDAPTDAGTHLRVDRLSPSGVLRPRVVFEPSQPGASVGEQQIALDPRGRLHIIDHEKVELRQDNHPLWGGHRAKVSRRELALPRRNGQLLVPASNGQKIYAFDESGRHVQTLDALTGVALRRFEYRGGLVVSSYDRHGKKTTIARDSSGRPTHVTDPSGRTTRLSFDNDRLSEVRDASGAAYRMQYDSGGLLTRFETPLGAVSTFAYDAYGRLVRDTNHATGGVWTLQQRWTATTSEVTVEHSEGKHAVYRTEKFADGHRRLNRGPDGETVSETRWNNGDFEQEGPSGRVEVKTTPDPRFPDFLRYPSRITTRTAQGQVKTVTRQRSVELSDPNDPLSLRSLSEEITTNGLTRVLHYDATTRTLRTTSPTGLLVTRMVLNDKAQLALMQATDTVSGISRTTRLTYDTRGRLIRVDGPRSNVEDVTRLSYDENDNLLSLVNALGHELTFSQHDALGRPTRITDANGVTMALAYNALGQVVRRALGEQVTEAVYDLLGNLAQSKTPLGGAIQRTYDSFHRMLTATTDNGQRAVVTRDAYGAPIRHQLFDGADKTFEASIAYDRGKGTITRADAFGRTTRLTYDGAVGPMSIVDAAGQRTSHIYDGLGRLTQIVDAEGGKTVLSYDEEGRLATFTDAEGHATRFAYNAFGEVLRRESPNTGVTTYSYGQDGQLSGSTDARGVVTRFDYDALGRLSAVHYPADPGQDVRYVYDQGRFGKGRLTAVEDESGVTSFAFDARGNVTETTQTIGTNRRLIRYTYDLGDWVESITYPSGRQVRYARDSYGRVTAVTTEKDGQAQTLLRTIHYHPDGSIKDAEYGNGLSLRRDLDLAGRLVTGNVGDVDQRSYTYDERGRLTHIGYALDSTSDQSFRYDHLGRLTYANGGYGTREYRYDRVGNRLSVKKNGVLDTYLYTAGTHRLASVEHTGGQTTRFAYDLAGRATQVGDLTISYGVNGRPSSAQPPNGPQIAYQHNAFGLRAVRGERVQTFTPDGRLLSDGDTEYVYLDAFPLAQVRGEMISLVHTDHLGTPVRLTALADGATEWRAEHLPFGELVSESGQLAQSMRLPGQHAEPQTGLFYNHHRDYLPRFGRYAQGDPMGLAGGGNAYLYARGNPLQRTDRRGLEPDRVDLTDPPGLSALMVTEVDDIASALTDGATAVFMAVGHGLRCASAECQAKFSSYGVGTNGFLGFGKAHFWPEDIPDAVDARLLYNGSCWGGIGAMGPNFLSRGGDVYIGAAGGAAFDSSDRYSEFAVEALRSAPNLTGAQLAEVINRRIFEYSYGEDATGYDAWRRGLMNPDFRCQGDCNTPLNTLLH